MTPTPSRARRRSRALAATALLALCVRGHALEAHDVWLLPSSFQVEVESPVRVDIQVGHLGQVETLARNSTRLLEFFAETPAQAASRAGGEGGENSEGFSERSRVDLAGVDGMTPAGAFRPESDGLYRFAYVGRPLVHELSPSRFESYLDEEGLKLPEGSTRTGQGSGGRVRESYARSLKSLVTTDGSIPLESNPPLGLPLELSLLELDDLGIATFELRHLGQTLESAQVEVAVLEGSAAIQRARTDAKGQVRFEIDAGTFLLTAVVLTPHPGPDAEWSSLWTSLTFERQAP